uniref:Iron(III) transport system ATP-binding protein n=1 Tax=Candidatus Kentrum sp. SD TaxID=2126332 RepID=A0A451BMN4_9GAMM|nr:MAG: iron(III) transport system ATP-binding protein [Candidatus Kentron sp. SD]VFK45378.1 MAG: iron(III) transport system ATP-binding protein [Candidatus Kentron sp. SD]VFK79536.1 MAG: iron(III) transport system ATP-binding protein [Candidatus Kentron sp. SD]
MTLEVIDISKRFGAKPVLTRVSCRAEAGGITTILGASGCGKTTLLRLVAGLEMPDEGRIVWSGVDITAKKPGERDVGLVFQEGGFYGHLSVRENLRLSMNRKDRRKDGASSIIAMAERFGLQHHLDSRAETLSGGEGQRLSLARSLIRNPRLMLLDEPFSNLDLVLQRQLREFVFDRLREFGKTSVLVTHDHQDAQAADGTVVLLEQGRVAQIDTWEGIYRHPKTPYAARLVAFLEPICITGSMEDGASGRHFVSRNIKIPVSGAVESTSEREYAQLYYRPEDLEPNDGRNKDACITGIAERSFYQGGARFCILRRESGERLTFRCRNGGCPQRGETVRLGLSGVDPILIWPDDGEIILELPQ